MTHSRASVQEITPHLFSFLSEPYYVKLSIAKRLVSLVEIRRFKRYIAMHAIRRGPDR